MDLAVLLNDLVPVLKEAGNSLLALRPVVLATGYENKRHGDFVSQADRETDALLRQRLTDLLPGSGVLSEEESELVGEGHWRWIVDPLDGTSNYLAGLPHWGVSVALERRESQTPTEPVWGRLVLGAVHLPALSQTYTALDGGGAMLNGDSIGVRPLPPGLSAVSHWWPAESALQPRFHQLVASLHSQLGSIRNLGSPAAELCLVASGVLQGFFATDMEPWDLAAGELIVREAGGWAGDPEGGSALVSGFSLAGVEPVLSVLRRQIGRSGVL